MKKYYKICRRNDYNHLLSYNVSKVSQPNKEEVIEYNINEWVKPHMPNSKLFVFNSLDAAINCLSKNGNCRNYEVYECEVKRPTKAAKYRGDGWWSNNLQEYWNIIKKAKKNKKSINKALEKSKEHFPPMPAGTVWCDELKLTKLVYFN